MFEPESPMLDLVARHRGVEGGKSLEFVWFSRDQLATLDVRPAFLRELLVQDPLEHAHIVQDETQFKIYRP